MFSQTALLLDLPSRRNKSGDANVERSREAAVGRAFHGSLLGLIGVGGIVTGLSSTGLVSYLFGGIGSVLGGVGLVLVGSAITHLARFGSRRSVVALGSTIGLGISTVFWGLTGVAAVRDALPLLWRIQLPVTVAVLGFGTVVLLLVLDALLGWFTDRTRSPQDGD